MLNQASNKNLDLLNGNKRGFICSVKKVAKILVEGFPFSSNFLINCFHLMILATLNFSALVPNKYLDILTPWIVVIATKSSPIKTLGLIIICGILQELNSAAPAGVYLTAYLFYYLTFLLSHEHLSWSNLHIKILSLLLCLLFVVSFQYISYTLLDGSIVYSFEKISELLIFLFCSTGLGLIYFHTTKISKELN